MATAGELRAEAREQINRCELAIERRESGLLLGRVLGLSEAQVLAWPERVVPASDAARYRALLQRRLAGEPFAYVVGDREFYGRRFAVDPRVLIPRPETEHLVEAVLALELAAGSRILDVGTGSGCIALTLALEQPGLRVLASDRSLGALRVAAGNRSRLGLDGDVPLLLGDLLDPVLPSSLDVVVSNPPYIDPTDRLSPEIAAFEPPLALYGGDRGLDYYRRLLAACAAQRRGACLMLEIGAAQLDAVTEIAADRFTVERLRHDYAGHPRVLELRRR